MRNLIPVVSFLAVLAARGAGFIGERTPWLRRLPHALAGLVLVVNGQWLRVAAETIENGSTDRFVLELAEFLNTHPDDRFFVSKTVRKALQRVSPTPRTNVTNTPTRPVDYAVFLPKDADNLLRVPSNRPGSAVAWFGPADVNIEYYWSLLVPRIVVARPEFAREFGILR